MSTTVMRTWLLAMVVVTVTVMAANIRSEDDVSESESSSVPTDTAAEDLPLHLQEAFHVLGQHLPARAVLPLSLTSKCVRACMGDVGHRALYHHVFVSHLPDVDLYRQFQRLCQRVHHSPPMMALLNAVPDAHLVRCIDRLPIKELRPHFDFVQELPVAAFRESFQSLYDSLKFRRHRIDHLELDFRLSNPDGSPSQWKAVITTELTRALPEDVPEIVRNCIADHLLSPSRDFVEIFITNGAFDLLLRPDVLFALMRFSGRRLCLFDLRKHGDVSEPDLLAVFPFLNTFWMNDLQSKLERLLGSAHCLLHEGSRSRPEIVWRLPPFVDYVWYQMRRQVSLGLDYDSCAIYMSLIGTRCPYLSELLTSPYDAATGDTHLHRICQQDVVESVFQILTPVPYLPADQCNPLLSVNLTVTNAAGRVPFQYATGRTLTYVKSSNPKLWERVQQSLPQSYDALLKVHLQSYRVKDDGAVIWNAVVQALPGIDQVAREWRRPHLPELSAEATTYVAQLAEKLRSGVVCGPRSVDESVWTSAEFDTPDGGRLSLPNGNTIVHYLFAAGNKDVVCNNIFDYILLRGCRRKPFFLERFFRANGDGRLPVSYISDPVLLRFLGEFEWKEFVHVLIENDPAVFIVALRRLLLSGDVRSSICESLHMLFVCADRITSLWTPALSAAGSLSETEPLLLQSSSPVLPAAASKPSSAEADVNEEDPTTTDTADDRVDGHAYTVAPHH